MMRRLLFVAVMVSLLVVVPISAQNRPGAFSTVAITDTSATALCVGGPATMSQPCVGGAKMGQIAVVGGIGVNDAAVPTAGIGITTGVPVSTAMVLYNDAGTLKWNGTTLAAGGAISGTAGAIAKFTAADAVGDSIITESGALITIAGGLAATTGAFSSTLTAAGNAGLAATKKLYLDGVAMSGDTYLVESAGNVLSLYSGGVESKLTSGVLTVSGFGTHTFSAGGTGANSLRINNTTDGTSNYAQVRLAGGTTVLEVDTFAQSYTTSGTAVAAGSLIEAAGAGGISVAASAADGTIRFYSGGATLKATVLTDWGVKLERGTPAVTTDAIYNVGGNLYFNGTQLQTGNTVPAGLIALFDAACGAGWTRFSALDGNVPRGASTYGGTGGADTHSHGGTTDAGGSHTHTFTTASAGAHTHSLSTATIESAGGSDLLLTSQTTGSSGDHSHTGTTAASATHTHTFGTGTASSWPKYLNMIYCKKD